MSQNISMPIHDFEGGLLLALFFAFLGGLLLNLMPCVLPVISFKILSFVKMSGQCRHTTLKHGVAFSSGVIFSFWVLAGIMLILQAYGRSAGWGFQLQEPLFVAILAAILTVFGLSLFGVFELGISMTALAGSRPQNKNEGLTGSFFSGVLATTVATPCTGPFLGSAIGFAVTLPPFQAMFIFTFLGLGMASPYLLLAYFPQLLRFLPKPGEWMVAFKEIMGFLMFGTVLWLSWVFGAQTSTLGIVLLLWALFFISFGCWIYGKWSSPVNAKMTRWIGYSMAFLCLSIGSFIIYRSVSPDTIAVSSLQKAHEDKIWQPFSESKIANLRKKGIPVFVDFTAKWCLICQTNHMVLSTPEVEAKFDQLGVVRMKADWTKNDPKISAALRRFGRNGVPLYVLYSPNLSDSPQILPQILTPDGVIKYLETLHKKVAEKDL
jgi:thiol:disulfide interchange protein